MYKLKILFAFLIFTFGILKLSLAQKGATERLYSIALKGFSLETLPKVLNEQNPNEFMPIYLHGVMASFNENNLAVRVGLNLYNFEKTIKNSSSSNEVLNGDINGYSLKLGVVNHVNYSVIQPYYGVDLGYRFQKFSNENEQSSEPYLVNTSKNSAFLAPVLGIKFNVIQDLCFFAESEFQIMYSYERVNQGADGRNYTFSKYNKFEYLFNPVTIGLQFSFGNKL